MGNNYDVKMAARLSFLLLAVWGLTGMFSYSQTYSDGPISLQVKVRDVRANHNDNDNLAFINLDAEFRMKIWAQDNADVDGNAWIGPEFLSQNNMGFPNTTNDFNRTLLNVNYPGPTCPQFFDLRIDAWEDDCPSDVLIAGTCSTVTTEFDGGCCVAGFNCQPWNGNPFNPAFNPTGCTAYNDDDERCNSNPFATGVDYRLGPPCQWYNHGYVSNPVTCPGNKYEPRIESFWRYTRGTGCSNAIQLGNVAPGFAPITHFNSNECYSNNWPASAANDVFYEINVTNPTGLQISLCSAPAFAGNNIYLLDGTCTQMAFNTGACGATSEIIEPICQPGIYYIVVDGLNAGSMGTFTLTVTEDPSILVRAEAGPNQAICEGNNTVIGAVLPQVTASNGLPPYTIAWTPNYNISNTTIANPTVAPLVTTEYFVTVTDANGCSVVDSVTVVVNPGTPMSIGPDQLICPGTNATINVLPNIFLQHFWSNGASGPTANSITTNIPGQYHVTVVDLNGCLSRDTMNLAYYPSPNLNLGVDTSICQGANLLLDATIPGGILYNWMPSGVGPTRNVTTAGTYSVIANDGNCNWMDTIVVGIDTLPIISIGPNQTICTGTTTTLDPGPGYPSYLWSDGSTNQTLTVTTPGVYSVTVTNTNGCTGTASMTLANDPNPTPNLGPDQDLCLGASLTLNAGAGYAAYQWFSGQTTQNILVTAPGTYAVTVTDGNGCQGSDTILISPLVPQPFDLGNDTTKCVGIPITLTAPGGFVSYNWSTGFAAQTTTVSTPGLVYCTVTDANGCVNVDSLNVTQAPQPAPALGPDQQICPGDQAVLNAGTGYVDYAWSNGDTAQVVFISSPGQYRVTVTNAFGCQGTDTVQISLLPAANVNLGPDPDLCDGQTVTINAGAGFSSYNWSNGAVTPSIIVGAGGQYSVTVTNSSGCEASDTTFVNWFPSPVVNLGNDTALCNGGQIVLDAGNAGSTFAWNTGPTSQSIIASTTGLYEVTVTSPDGCQTVDNIQVDISPPLVVTLGNDTAICDSGFVLLDAGAGLASYNWAGPNGFSSQDQIIFADQNGNYAVTVTDQFGCTGIDNINITTGALLAGTFLGNDTVGCEGQPVLLDAGDSYTLYNWDNGSQDQFLLVDSSGTYGVEVQDADGCRYRDEIQVTIETFPRLVLTGPGFICPNETETLDAGGGYTDYLWSTGETTQTIDISQPGTYSVTVSYNSCTQVDDVLVTDDCAGRLFIPNVFSPNSDGINDEFTFVAVKLESFSIWIYDRWGKFLFESDNINNAWNGKAPSGKDVPEGVYYYRIQYKFLDNENVLEKNGNVTVLR